MKKTAFIGVVLCLLAEQADASSYLEDVKNLGYISGGGLACGASLYPSYEFIARAYLISKARSDAEQAEGMYEYNQAKATAYLEKRGNGYYDCPEVNRRFNNQKILKSIVYKNGIIKLPDGKIIRPRQEYNASLVYNRDEDERGMLNKYYDKIIARKKRNAEKQGIYQKIRQEEMKARRTL